MSINIYRDDEYRSRKRSHKGIRKVGAQPHIDPLDERPFLFWGQASGQSGDANHHSFQHYLRGFLEEVEGALEEDLAQDYQRIHALSTFSLSQQKVTFQTFFEAGLQWVHQLNLTYNGSDGVLTHTKMQLAKIVDVLFIAVTQYGYAPALRQLLDLFKALDARSALHPHATIQFKQMLLVDIFPLRAHTPMLTDAKKRQKTLVLKKALREILSHEYFPSKLHELK